MKNKDKKPIDFSLEEIQFASEVHKLWNHCLDEGLDFGLHFFPNENIYLGKGKYRVLCKPTINGKPKGNC